MCATTSLLVYSLPKTTRSRAYTYTVYGRHGCNVSLSCLDKRLSCAMRHVGYLICISCAVSEQ